MSGSAPIIVITEKQQAVLSEFAASWGTAPLVFLK
jgi:hypothetical protein